MKHHYWRVAAALLAIAVAGGPTLAQLGPVAPGAPGPVIPLATGLTVDQVTELQTLLAQLGFDPLGIDGIVGPGTRAAVSAAQRALGVSVDGEPSLAFLERLRQEPDAAVAPSLLPPAG